MKSKDMTIGWAIVYVCSDRWVEEPTFVKPKVGCVFENPNVFAHFDFHFKAKVFELLMKGTVVPLVWLGRDVFLFLNETPDG